MKYFFFFLILSTPFRTYSESIEEYLEKLRKGPALETNCDRVKYKNKQETGNEEESISPGIFMTFELRNDVFAAPFMAVRNRRFHLWDMGETHGIKATTGVRFKNGFQFLLKYRSRLFGESEHNENWLYLQRAKIRNGGVLPKDFINKRHQTFTSEQLYTITLNTPKLGGFNYSLEAGFIDYESADDQSWINASAQQKALHGSLDSLINIQNIHSSSVINGFRFVLIPQVIKNIPLGENSSLSAFLKARITSSSAVNNLSAGITARFKIPHTSLLSSHYEFSLPVFVYKDFLNEGTAVGFHPSASVALQYKRVKFGYRIDVPFGDFHQNIPQYAPTYNNSVVPGRTLSDQEEMGTIFIEINP